MWYVHTISYTVYLALTYPTSPGAPVTPANPKDMPTIAAVICLNQWTHTGKSSYVSWGGGSKTKQ